MDDFLFTTLGMGFLLFFLACFVAGLCEKNTRKKSRLLCEDKEHEQGILEQGGWKCECGRVNPHYTGTCACGRISDSRIREEIRRAATITEPEEEVTLLNHVSEGEWIGVVTWGNEWASTSVYIDKERKKVKIVEESCSHWGYHDESAWDEEEYVVSVEEAMKRFASHHAILCKLKNYIK